MRSSRETTSPQRQCVGTESADIHGLYLDLKPMIARIEDLEVSAPNQIPTISSARPSRYLDIFTQNLLPVYYPKQGAFPCSFLRFGLPHKAKQM